MSPTLPERKSKPGLLIKGLKTEILSAEHLEIHQGSLLGILVSLTVSFTLWLLFAQLRL